MCQGFFIKLLMGDLQLCLNETPAQILSCESCIVSQKTYLQNIFSRVSIVSSQVLVFPLCEELQGNEDHRFRKYVNVNEFKKSTTKFQVMWGDIYLHEATAPSLLFSKI